MRSFLYVLPVLIFAGFAGFALQGLFREDPDNIPSVIVGSAAPTIQVEPMAGLLPPVPDDLRNGDISLVNFWASWCAPCRAEHPHLVYVSEQGIPVIGVNYRDDPENAQAFLQELGNPFAGGGADPRGRTALEWGVYGLPETFIVDGEGTVLYRLAGPLTQRSWDERAVPDLQAKGVDLPELSRNIAQ